MYSAGISNCKYLKVVLKDIGFFPVETIASFENVKHFLNAIVTDCTVSIYEPFGISSAKVSNIFNIKYLLFYEVECLKYQDVKQFDFDTNSDIAK